MSRLIGSLAALVLVLPLAAHAEDYAIDPVHSSANFSVRHMMVSTVHGRFTHMKGTVHYDPKHVGNSTVTATIDATSITTDNDRRDADLKSDHFFDVAKYPTITFTSTSVKRAGRGKLRVTGTLTMHGVTRPVTLKVEGPLPDVKDPWGNAKSGVTATTEINRKDFGLTWNKVLEAGGVMVGDQIKIELDIEMAAQKMADQK